MFQIKAKLLYNKRVNNNYFHCAFLAPAIAKEANPGQFVNIKLTDTVEPLLRRPFSIHRIRGKDIEILYEVLGQGTEILAHKQPGEYLDVIGSLGNGFNYRLPPACLSRRGITDYRLPILIAGGMGVAPLIFLQEKLAELKIKNSTLRLRSGLMVSEVDTSIPLSVDGERSRTIEPSKFKIVVLIGAKTKSQILCEKEFKKLGCEVRIATDDGSRGFKGKVTDLLKSLLRLTPCLPEQARDYRLPITIYACGPRPMLKEISLLSKKHNIPAQISLEEHMACGIGACFGCVVNTTEGFKRVCKDGPVFNADKIIW